VLAVQVTAGTIIAAVRPIETPDTSDDALGEEISEIVDEMRLPYILLQVDKVDRASGGDLAMLQHACPGISEGDTYVVGSPLDALDTVHAGKPVFKPPEQSTPLSVMPSQVIWAEVQLTKVRRGHQLASAVAASCKVAARACL
jgi:hypothetical protein